MLTTNFTSYNPGCAGGFGQCPLGYCPCNINNAWGGFGGWGGGFGGWGGGFGGGATGATGATGANPVDPYPNPNPDCIHGCIEGNNPDCPKCPWADCCRVYGGLINSNPTTLVIPRCTTGNSINLNGPLPMQNVAFNGVNNLRIQCSGMYQITIFGNFRAEFLESMTHLTFYVKANGHTVAETVVNLNITPNTDYSFERTVFVRFCANTTLSMIVDHTDLSCEPGYIGTPSPGNITMRIPANGFHMEVKRVGKFAA